MCDEEKKTTVGRYVGKSKNEQQTHFTLMTKRVRKPKTNLFFYILRFNCVRYFGLRMYKPLSGAWLKRIIQDPGPKKYRCTGIITENCVCYKAALKFLLNCVRSHWLLRSHMTSINENVSRQNLCKICNVRG